MLEKVIEVVAEVMGIDANGITAETRFIEDLDADSLDVASMIMELEQEYGVEFNEDDMAEIKTVGDACKMCEKYAE